MTYGAWHLFYFEYDDGAVRLVIDGDTENEVTGTRQMAAYDTDIFLGSRQGGSTNWDGEVQDMAWHSRPLTAAELAQRYNGGTAERIPGL